MIRLFVAALLLTGCSTTQPACEKHLSIEEEKRRVIPEEEEGADSNVIWCAVAASNDGAGG